MNADEVVGIIELGNIDLKCLIFKANIDNIEIVSSSVTPSDGFHNDVVVNLSKATNAVRSCISVAEKKAKVSLKKINIVFEQPDFLCTKFSKHKKIDGAKIHKDDIDFLLKEAKKQLILNDKKQSIIHIFNHNYVVDNKPFIEEPIGVYADSITHEITFITAPKNNLKNINQVFVDCDIEITRLISKGFAQGAELLNHKELESGSIILDFGFEKTTFILFKKLAVVHSITLPIGSHNIIKDISKVCSLSIDESELILKKTDFSFKKNDDLFDNNNYLKKIFFTKSNYRKISKVLILDVIQARLDEIISITKKQLLDIGFTLTSGISILVSGDSLTLLKNIEQYFINHFGFNVKKANIIIIEKDINPDKDFTSCMGALKVIKDGWETEAIPKISSKNIQKAGLIERIFKINK